MVEPIVKKKKWYDLPWGQPEEEQQNWLSPFMQGYKTPSPPMTTARTTASYNPRMSQTITEQIANKGKVPSWLQPYVLGKTWEEVQAKYKVRAEGDKETAAIRQQELATSTDPLVRAANAPLFNVAGVGISSGDLVGLAMLAYGVYDAGSSIVRGLTAYKKLPQYTALVDYAKNKKIPQDSPEFKNIENAIKTALDARNKGMPELGDEIMAMYKASYDRAMGLQPLLTEKAGQPMPAGLGGIDVVPKGTLTGALTMGTTPAQNTWNKMPLNDKVSMLTALVSKYPTIINPRMSSAKWPDLPLTARQAIEKEIVASTPSTKANLPQTILPKVTTPTYLKRFKPAQINLWKKMGLTEEDFISFEEMPDGLIALHTDPRRLEGISVIAPERAIAYIKKLQDTLDIVDYNNKEIADKAMEFYLAGDKHNADLAVEDALSAIHTAIKGAKKLPTRLHDPDMAVANGKQAEIDQRKAIEKLLGKLPVDTKELYIVTKNVSLKAIKSSKKEWLDFKKQADIDVSYEEFQKHELNTPVTAILINNKQVGKIYFGLSGDTLYLSTIQIEGSQILNKAILKQIDVALSNLAKEYGATKVAIANLNKHNLFYKAGGYKYNSYTNTYDKSIISKATIPPVPPVTSPPTAVAAEPPEDPKKILEDFGRAIQSPESIEAINYLETRRTSARVKENEQFMQTLRTSLAAGDDMDVALNKAMTVFKKLPGRGFTTTLVFPDEVRQAAYKKIVDVITADPKIGEKVKAFEIAATRKAFDMTIARIEEGKIVAIPRTPGTAGGSRYSRLVRIFGKESEIMKVLEKPEKLVKVLQKEAEGRAPIPVDPAILEYIRNLPTKPFRTPEFGGAEPYNQLGFNLGGKPKPLPAQKQAMLGEVPPVEEIETRLAESAWTEGGLKAPPKTEADRIQLMLDLASTPEDILKTEYPPDIALKELSLIPPEQRSKVVRALFFIKQNVVDILNIPISLMASGDISAFARQEIVMTYAHPTVTLPALGQSLVAAFEEGKENLNKIAKLTGSKNIYQAKYDTFQVLDYALRHGEFAWLIDGAGKEGRTDLFLPVMPVKNLKNAGLISEREESAASWFAQHIPGIKLSNELFIMMLNRSRVAMFNFYARQWNGLAGEKTLKDYGQLIKLINLESGRGAVPKSMNVMMPFLNSIFWAPRLALSMPELIAFAFSPPQLTWHKGMPKYSAVGKIAAQDLAKFISTGLGITALALAAGWKLETDRSSSRFGQIGYKDTWVNIWGAGLPLARTSLQMLSGEYTSASGYTRESSRLDIGQKYLRSKLAPQYAVGYDLLAGSTITGEEVSTKPEFLIPYVAEKFAPLTASQFYDAFKLEGLLPAAGAGALNLIGYSAQTYSTTLSVVSDVRSALHKAQEDRRKQIAFEDDGDMAKSAELWADSLELRNSTGLARANLQIIKLEKMRDKIEKTKGLTYQQRTAEINVINNQISTVASSAMLPILGYQGAVKGKTSSLPTATNNDQWMFKKK